MLINAVGRSPSTGDVTGNTGFVCLFYCMAQSHAVTQVALWLLHGSGHALCSGSGSGTEKEWNRHGMEIAIK